MSTRRASGLGPTEMFVLRQWGTTLKKCFGEMPYLVGSCGRDEPFRDVDVRIMLDDDDPLLLDAERWPGRHGRLTALNVAITIWGQKVTGLPIDFQFQSATAANAEYGDQVRNPIGVEVDPRPISGDIDPGASS